MKQYARFGRAFRSALPVLLLLALFVTSCGGGEPNSDTAGADEPVQTSRAGREIPTMPAAQFAAPTTMIDPTKVAASGETPEAAEPDLELGASAYARLCAECHGDGGEGVADKGEAIAGMELDDAAFDDLLRTGGGYGNEHNFGPSKISDDGIADLYAFVQTLGDE